MSTPVMIEADGLCKQFGSFLAVRDVSFSIPKGQVVAFLGPNGAGKTTTMRLLTGFVAPTHGIGPDRRDRRPGRPDRGGRAPGLPARERPALSRHDPDRACSSSSARPAGCRAAELQQPDRRRGRASARWSRWPTSRSASSPRAIASGSRWRRRCLHDPEVLIMDEPTSGLDPNQIRGVRPVDPRPGQVEDDPGLDPHPPGGRAGRRPGAVHPRRQDRLRRQARRAGAAERQPGRGLLHADGTAGVMRSGEWRVAEWRAGRIPAASDHRSTLPRACESDHSPLATRHSPLPYKRTPRGDHARNETDQRSRRSRRATRPAGPGRSART